MIYEEANMLFLLKDTFEEHLSQLFIATKNESIFAF